MKLRDFTSISENINQLEEAGGFVDQKVLSRFGTKRTKANAQTRITDAQRAEQLWDAWLEVTGGGDEFNINELVSWLIKEVKIDGINIDKNLINDALSDSNYSKILNSPVSTDKSKTNPSAPVSVTKKPAPRKKPLAKKPEASTNTKSTPKSHPADGGFVSLDLPAMSASEDNWHAWATKLAKEQPGLYMNLAKSFGAKVSSPNRKRSK